MHTNIDVSHLNKYVAQEILGLEIIENDEFIVCANVNMNFDDFNKLICKKLNLNYLDSGAIYRLIAFSAMEKKVDLENDKNLVDLIRQVEINFINEQKEPIIWPFFHLLF